MSVSLRLLLECTISFGLSLAQGRYGFGQRRFRHIGRAQADLTDSVLCSLIDPVPHLIPPRLSVLSNAYLSSFNGQSVLRQREVSQ